MRSAGSLIALIVGFVLAAPVRGDLLPIARGNVEIRVAFENLHEYPAYDFYVKYDRNPRTCDMPELLKITPGEPCASGTTTPCDLEGVSACGPARAARRATVLSGAAQLAEGRAGGRIAIRALVADETATPLTMNSDGADILYRIHLDGDRLEATWVATRFHADPRTYICVAIAATCSIAAAAGVLLFRYAFRRQPVDHGNGAAKPA